MPTSFPLKKIKVVLLENIHPCAKRLFEDAGFSVHQFDRSLHGDELLEVAGDAHLIGIRSKTKLDGEFLTKAKNLWGIGCFCIGTNQVDLEEAARCGIPVFNAPFQNTRSVAELVICEIIALHRQLFDRSAAMHRGEWRKSAKGAHEIRGRTLGIVGYGRIGSQVSVLAESMGLNVIFHDIVDVLPMGNAMPADGLVDLLERSDIVTLHVPATSETKNMIGAGELSKMQSGSFLLNNARGNVVDIEALRACLDSGHLGGAAIDVFPEEPSANHSKFMNTLQNAPNVILTPHIGGSTAEAQENIANSAASRLIKLMNNGTTATAVNVPQVQLPRLHSDHHRILHFHRNVPGVLSKLHTAIAELGINIAAEFLQSDPAHAYMILDISPSTEESALNERLLAFDETIRVRMLW